MAVLIVGTMLLVVKPIDTLDEVYESSIDDGYTNVEYLGTLRGIEASRRGDESVLLDPLLNQVKTLGGGKASTNFNWLLAVSRIPSETPTELTASPGLTGRLGDPHCTTANRRTIR